jgi:hypothetical protein
MGDNMGQSAGTRQQEEARQAAVSLATALLLQEGKGLMAPSPHPSPFMIIVSPGRLGLALATDPQLNGLTGSTAQRLDGLGGLTGLTA